MPKKASLISIAYKPRNYAESTRKNTISYLLEMLEHIPEPEQVIQAAAKLVKPGGDLFSTTNATKSLCNGGWCGVFIKNCPRHARLRKIYSPLRNCCRCRKADLTVEDISGYLQPITQKFKIEANDVDVNYIVHVKRRLISPCQLKLYCLILMAPSWIQVRPGCGAECDTQR